MEKTLEIRKRPHFLAFKLGRCLPSEAWLPHVFAFGSCRSVKPFSQLGLHRTQLAFTFTSSTSSSINAKPSFVSSTLATYSLHQHRPLMAFDVKVTTHSLDLMPKLSHHASVFTSTLALHITHTLHSSAITSPTHHSPIIGSLHRICTPQSTVLTFTSTTCHTTMVTLPTDRSLILTSPAALQALTP